MNYPVGAHGRLSRDLFGVHRAWSQRDGAPSAILLVDCRESGRPDACPNVLVRGRPYDALSETYP